MKNNIFQQVGSNIQAILEERGLTQQSLADKLNISKQVMSKIINGSKAINVMEITTIANVLNVEVNKLLVVNSPTDEEHSFSFMGRIKNEQTREKIEILKDVIDEILLMEEYVSEQ